MSGEPGFEAGAVVHDRDDKDPNDAVVVNTPPVTAAEWDVRPRGTTLAEDNPTYPEDAAVVIVVFRETLNEYFDREDVNAPAGTLESAMPISHLAEEQIRFYAFPAPRLDATGEHYEYEDRSDDPDSAAASVEPAENVRPDRGAIDALEDRLANSGMRVVDRDDETGTLTIEKMRDTYRVKPGEVIEGEGRFRPRLEQLVTVDGANNE